MALDVTLIALLIMNMLPMLLLCKVKAEFILLISNNRLHVITQPVIVNCRVLLDESMKLPPLRVVMFFRLHPLIFRMPRSVPYTYAPVTVAKRLLN